MSGTFKDHFSRQAPDYARFRPNYPGELFAWLAGISPSRGAAWDCGTGSGQAAVGLAAHFEHVIATDPSRKQLEHAEAHPRVEYRVASAEVSLLDTASIDLVTVAQAIHWFDLEKFYAEARRVLKPGGVIAAWTYTLLDVEAGIDELLTDFYRNVVGPYWPPERRMVDDRYRSLPFPFEPIAPPAFEIRTEWTRDDLLGYLGTWSATQAYMKANGIDPLDEFARRLTPLWPDAALVKALRWPLHLRVGRSK
ncbi:MAG: SAM-dependent methyltransferase [Rhodocyclales bacterium]|jgi:SAM-dependent methyltransferase|nr:class I SAM-dependent methyltransferase [Rhodocyclaceae bacterium]PWB39738.1 MAG: SAM-dependent methyltransferase [Rhodocyclales bacterium]